MISDVPSTWRVHFNLPPADYWHYRIEGGQKIVFSCRCSNFPPQILAVFPITDHSPCHPPSVRPQVLISRHLSRFLLPSIQIRLKADYLLQLGITAKRHRPPYRTAQLSSDYPYATVYPDVALYFGSQTILVELKPKYALLSRSRLIPPHQAKVLRKYTTPTYHIKNYLVPDRCIPKRPYDPSDLLSMDIGRVTNAVDTLREENSRSLRVFEDGVLADPNQHKAALEAAAHALAAAKQCCLGLLELQAYDILDNAGAATILLRLQKLVGESNAYALIRHHLYYDSPYDPSSEILCYKTAKEASKKHCMAAYREAMKAVDEFSAERCAQLLAGFLQAAVAKDCSLLIALSPASCVNRVDEDRIVTNDGKWVSRIWVIDIGEKAISKILGKWKPEDCRRTQLLEDLEPAYNQRHLTLPEARLY